MLAQHFFLGKKLHSPYTCHVANTFLLITDNIWHYIIIIIITSAVLTMHAILFICISVYTVRWKWEGRVCIIYATSFLWVTRCFVEKYVWMKEIFEQLVWKTHNLKCLLAKDKVRGQILYRLFSKHFFSDWHHVIWVHFLFAVN